MRDTVEQNLFRLNAARSLGPQQLVGKTVAEPKHLGLRLEQSCMKARKSFNNFCTVLHTMVYLTPSAGRWPCSFRTPDHPVAQQETMLT